MRLLVYCLLLIAAMVTSCGETQPCVDLNNVNNTAICNNTFDPVCGCDNFTYQNKCFAERAGVVSWIGGPCP